MDAEMPNRQYQWSMAHSRSYAVFLTDLPRGTVEWLGKYLQLTLSTNQL